MKYILMMTGAKADFDWYAKWSKQDLQAHAAFMHAFNKELKDPEAFFAAEGRASPSPAKFVRAGSTGEPITDGVLPEAKEFLAGFCTVGVETAAIRYAWAALSTATIQNPARNSL